MPINYDDPKVWEGMFKSAKKEHSRITTHQGLILKERLARIKELEAEVEELKKFKEQTEEQTLTKLFKKLLN